jgi:ABC-type Fe3+-hydroxamate transport system substrate-binding protein
MSAEGRHPRGARRWSARRLAGVLALSLLTVLVAAGCVSKGKAQAEARAAFVAGQQQAFERTHQLAQGPSVTVVGLVRYAVIPWTEELTVAKAIVASGYYGPDVPTAVEVVRNGQVIPMDPNRLLRGEDMPLEVGDVLRIR